MNCKAMLRDSSECRGSSCLLVQVTTGPGTQRENRNLLCIFKQPYKGKELNLLWFWMWMVPISQKEAIKEITNIPYLIHQLKDRYLKSLGLQSRRNSNYVLSRLSMKNKIERFLVKCEIFSAARTAQRFLREILRLVWIEYGNVCVTSGAESITQRLQKRYICGHK